MGHPNQTSSVTPLRAISRAVSFAAFGCLLLGQPPAFAQSASQQQASTTNNRTTNNAAAGFDDETDVSTTPAANGTAATVDETQQRPAIADAQPGDEITGSILDEDMRRLNTREARVDETLPGRRAAESASTAETPGIPLGTFVLRPSVTQSINTETTKDGDTRQRRAFLETDAAATLTSDWGRHQLSVTSEGAWQKNISGEGEEQPSFKINGDLRLDLPQDTVAHLTAGYNFYREDTDDPDAIANATQQSDVQEFSAGASVQRDFGILRGTTALALTRSIYSDATLASGATVTLSDRNQTTGTLRGRVGYELSPALIPFIEATIGRTIYDERATPPVTNVRATAMAPRPASKSISAKNSRVRSVPATRWPTLKTAVCLRSIPRHSMRACSGRRSAAPTSISTWRRASSPRRRRARAATSRTP